MHKERVVGEWIGLAAIMVANCPGLLTLLDPLRRVGADLLVAAERRVPRDLVGAENVRRAAAASAIGGVL